ncbi:hypothetical protein OIU77_011998 [Salix suchowensis]|nr:glycosyltransferase [Salix suchowensis]KAJ6322029.1 hypothetical protein OIU77_011998 [Salix suchowensis]
MKGLKQSLATTFTKLFNAILQPINVLYFFFLFGCGLATGVILSSNLKSVSCNLLASQFSVSAAPTETVPLATLPAFKLPRIGLKEHLKVPDVKHDMDEKELLWRASMTPRIREYPFDRVPKVAFMFLTKGPVLMAPLWEKFFQGHEGMYSIYVHSSPSYNESKPESPVFHGRRIPSKDVQWGSTNIIEAERRLLANALLDISNQRFVLLSESCIPIFDFSTVYTHLMNSTKNHVESYVLNGPVGNGRYDPRMRPVIKIEQWRKGSQWFEMDRDLAIDVVSDQKYFPLFQKHCKRKCYADEHYLPTFVSMKHPERNSNRSLTWVDWSRGGAHPAKFSRTRVTVELLERMRSGSKCMYNGNSTSTCFLFARKLCPDALDRLLRFAPKVMHFNS